MAEESENFGEEIQPLETLPPSPSATPTPASPEDGDGDGDGHGDGDGDGDGDGPPDAKRRRTSVVWNDFMKKNVGGIDYAFCRHCGKKYKALSKNGTKSLHIHLSKCLKREASGTPQPLLVSNKREIRKSRVGNVTSDHRTIRVRGDGNDNRFLSLGESRNGRFGNFTSDHIPLGNRGDGEDERFHAFLFNQEVAQQALASAIVLHEYPLSIVDHVGFRSFSSTLQPFFRMASIEEIKSEIKRIHITKKEDVYSMLEKLTNRIAITADMWTSDSKKSYMSITAHFLDESWVLQKCDLRFVYVPVPHTKETLWNHLTGCLLDFNILKNISTVTMGSCTSSDEISPANLKLLNSGLLLGGKLLHMQCGAHILKLLAKDGLSVIDKVTDKIRDSVGFWSATPSREETFSNTTNQMKFTYKKLNIDDPNQWNSTYLMLRSCIEYKEVFLKLKEKESLYTSAPSDEEWDLAADICERIKLFYRAAKMFSGSKHISSNNYFVKLCEIKEALGKWIASPNKVINQMASTMFLKFNDYWNSVHVVLAVAAVLDPRYKLKLVQYFFIVIYGSNSWPEVERIRKAISDLFDEYQTRFGLGSEPTNKVPSEAAVTEESDHLSQYDVFVRQNKIKNVARKTLSELEQYLDDPVLPRDQDFDALRWWKSDGTRYPFLRTMAQDFLSIPISVATSDPAFRFDGRVVPSSRTRLEPDSVETLMCSHNWMWNEMESTGFTNDSQTCSDDDED